MEKSVVSVKNLSHRYSVQWAVKDVSFEINEKGVTGLLGSNGAGKSTTMNIICGVLNQTQGDVFINGVNLRENPVEAKKNIGFLPQQPPLYTDLTVGEYLRHAALLRLVEPDKVDEARLGIGKMLHYSFQRQIDKESFRRLPAEGRHCPGHRP